MKVTIVGPYPEPYGGVSIHVRRLRESLKENNIYCTVYDVSGVPKKEENVFELRSMKIWLFKEIFHCSGDIVHFHGYNPKILGLLSLLVGLKKREIVITLHSFRYSTENFNFWNKLAFRLAKRARVRFIAVGPEIKKKVISLGISPKHIEVIPSFIPPVVRDDEVAEIPKETWDFMDSHSSVISANASKIAFYKNEDLYGIDMCIELCANLKKDYPRIGFVFCLPDIGDYKYFKKMKQNIVEKGIESNFFFQNKPCQFYPILMKSDVFVRPTNTDGYGISIAEAIYFKIPAVASDVCLRPYGTIIFKNRDIDDFTKKVKDVLDNYKKYKKKIVNIELKDNIKKIVRVYKSLVNKK